MGNPIVTVIVSQQQAPAPNTLQKTGAMISQGGTTLPAGSSALIQQPADLTINTPAGVAISNASWLNGQVTVTVASTLPAVGTKFQTSIAGIVPGTYNGTVWAIVQSPTTFSYSRPTNPGGYSSGGTFTSPAVGELAAMVNTFFAQGYQQGVYVLELGAGTPSEGVAALTAFINANDQTFYSYLVPRSWDANTDFLALISSYETTTSKTYFFVTTTLATYQTYLNGADGTSTHKDLVTLIEAPQYGSWPRVNVSSTSWAIGKTTHVLAVASTVKPGDWVTLAGFSVAGYNGTFQAQPGTTGTALVVNQAVNPAGTPTGGYLAASVYSSAGIAANEFTMAAAWWVTLNYSPGATTRVPPYSYSFLKGVTRFPPQGNQTAMAVLKLADVNIVGFGGEGGISDNILLYGHTMDGRPFNYWYSVDWMQINIDLNIANAIINGSNTTVNPLYYNQDGINRLAGVASGTGASGISFGLALGRVVQVGLPQQEFVDNVNRGQYAGALVVNADPFAPYLTRNPTHYAQGLYGGLTMVYSPLRGFEHIIFNIVVTDFVASA
jgi:hypothetical protein